MKILIIILLILFSFAAGAQVFTPQTAAGYQDKRHKTDSTDYIPTFCGVPNLRSTVAQKMGAIAFDSCNHRFYVYDPKTNVWDTIMSRGDINTYFDTTINNYITNITIDSIREGEEHLYFTTERVRGSIYADGPILYDSAFGRFYLDTASETGVATKHDLIHIDTAVIGVTGYMSGDTSIISIDKNGGGNNKIYLVDPGGTPSDSTIIATASQTVFSFSTFTGVSNYRNDIVYLNGYPLTPVTDYIATGNSIILSYGCDAGDKLRYHK